jgi:hypothetical protein
LKYGVDENSIYNIFNMAGLFCEVIYMVLLSILFWTFYFFDFARKLPIKMANGFLQLFKYL